MPSGFGPKFPDGDYVTLEVPWECYEVVGNGHGPNGYQHYWDGKPYQPGSRLLMDVPANEAHYFLNPTNPARLRVVED